eukprot:COSAG06_NODE_3065_length_5901_cov_5.700965_3_plen_261_part_00
MLAAPPPRPRCPRSAASPRPRARCPPFATPASLPREGWIEPLVAGRRARDEDDRGTGADRLLGRRSARYARSTLARSTFAGCDTLTGSIHIEDDLGNVQIDGYEYADDTYVTAGVADTCLHPSPCYRVTVTGPSTARWSIHDATGVVVIAGAGPTSERVCHCGHHGGDGCASCIGVAEPNGGTFGSCDTNGDLVHDNVCLATCPGGVMPNACWNGTISTPDACCFAGTWWDGEHASPCKEFPAWHGSRRRRRAGRCTGPG